MFASLKRFLCWLDDLAEVLVFHVLFSRANWKKTTVALLLATLALTHGSTLPEKLAHVRPAQLITPASEYANRGYEALLKGRRAEAIKNLELAVARDPGKALYMQRLGLAYLEAGQNDRAQIALEKAYRLQASRTTLFYQGCVYQNMKLNDVAIGYFKQVKSAQGKDALLAEPAASYEPVANAKIGECYIRKGEYDLAIDTLTRTTQAYPSYPHAYFYLGIAHWEKGDLDRGVEQMFKVIELYPAESAAYYNVACYYAIKGIPDLALVWLEKSFAAGFAQFRHIQTDHDLDSIRQLPQFGAMVAKYEKVLPHED